MYPDAYIKYLAHFHGDRDYFECHEILEEYWKEVDKGNKESIWVAFIQLAVGCYHHRRSNFTGAERTIQKAIGIFIKEKDNLAKVGINGDLFYPQLIQILHDIKQKREYHSFTIPLSDPLLFKAFQARCVTEGISLDSKNLQGNLELINKHSSRDRSGVVAERKQALINKSKKNKSSD